MQTRNKNIEKEERKYLVLGHIVYQYVNTAVPVSSKMISEMMGSRISSATVRNIMAELEDNGFIEQPHTSAGRIPTQSGYRRYVDMIKDKIVMERKEARRLASEYSRRIRTIKEVIETTSFLISRELHNAGLVMWPSIEDFYLKHIELIKIKAETVHAILVTMTNAVRNYIVKLDRDVENVELKRVANYVNSRYEKCAIQLIYEDFNKMIAGDADTDREIFGVAKVVLKVVDAIIDENIESDVYCEGLNYFAEKNEFKDLAFSGRILHLFSERKELAALLRQELPASGLNVYIGKENLCEDLKECSIITSGYAMRGRIVGRLGVVGPTRMDYFRALHTVSYLSGLVSAKIEEINRQGDE